ncbi:Alcohol dehydrogenase transcription factor Myb/SANT-like [Popillia japonica]|uniref:Alcohol dehydrogenase transcription factor Myb/SANT-like n=1 Tax=Popillia japonica TaxID=7064 RepID=A0AAW1KKA5_POPJA
MSRWNEETTLKFVQEYRERPCLWNTRASIYKNKQAREAAYKEIEQNMGLDGFGVGDIKNKIRALRSTYSQEKKKIKDSMKSGTGSDDVYVPNIKCFNPSGRASFNVTLVRALGRFHPLIFG